MMEYTSSTMNKILLQVLKTTQNHLHTADLALCLQKNRSWQLPDGSESPTPLQYWPPPHGEHSDPSLRATREPYVPSGHGSGAEVPSGQKKPCYKEK